MYGDFSRGHEPDRARGRGYRRVLLQQGRPVLDSDMAAGADALLHEIRASTEALGCGAGSSDLGHLVTPGRLVTVFARGRRDMRVLEGGPDARVDFRHRFAERYPALRLAAPSGPVRVRIPAVEPLTEGAGEVRLTLWARAEAPVTVTVNGVSVPVSPAADGPVPVTFTAAGTAHGSIELGLASGEVWLFLLERSQPFGANGGFAVAGGTYQVDGLVVRTRGGDFPEVTFPAAEGFDWQGGSPAPPPLQGLTWAPEANERAVAYLEVWERLVTPVEDPGIREVALGPTDTCVRTELIGQVKLAEVSPSIPVPGQAGTILEAFGAVEPSGGELEVTVPRGGAATDPCALPEADGYSGDDNRLYRIEVHRGGPPAQVRFKWSRDNGGELFPATLSSGGDLVLDAATPLAAGDLVEVLSGVIDLGDDVHAKVTPAAFVPARRAVGQLGQLVEVPVQDGDTLRFRLAEARDASVPVALDGRYGVPARARLKLRRWHGVLDPRELAGGGTPTGGPYVLEDGVTVTLPSGGTYRPGDYWQYQARAGTASPEPWRRRPHGPARRFVPLALLRAPEPPGPGTRPERPWELVAWLDERFDRLCGLNADGVGFDGDRVGGRGDTVQEALEELYERLPPALTWPTVTELNWRNDRPLPMSQFTEGLRVEFSEEMHPGTASTSSFVVTLEVPHWENEQVTYPLIVDGAVSATGRTWTFTPTGVSPQQVGEWVASLGGGVRCRVRLAADVILDRGGTRPLDGAAAGTVRDDGYETYVDLRLPSGGGGPGRDFHSWFFIDGPPALVRVESVFPADAERITGAARLGAVLVTFSGAVRFDTLTPLSMGLYMRREEEDGVGEPVPGTIRPYPFEPDPHLVSRVSFAPDDPALLQPEPGAHSSPMVFTLQLVGTGDDPVLDAEGRALDGAGIGEPSEFVSHFIVEREVQ
ncbi:DUF6519 domain-containing protein [Actinomadura sp. 21ATH]|uniref:DUF6519 domain-containing protein n=1 Tax=Actinomadura sp. 21ATH TaxID=1735444 RepID=UPI0035C04AF6